MPAWRAPAHDRLLKALDLPMLILSVGFLAVLIWPIADPGMSARTREELTAADWFIWAVFGVEYVALLVTARDRRQYVRTHVLDLVVIALPMLRPLRLVRSVRLVRLLRLARLASMLASSARRSRSAFLSKALLFALSLGGLVVLAASVVVLDVERDHAGANIHSLGDALWWAVTTSTTVGYGDRYPVTSAGRGVAVVLMLVGLAIVGVVTASIAAWLVTLTQANVEQAEYQQEVDLQSVLAQLKALQSSVNVLHDLLTAGPVGPAVEGLRGQ